MRVVVTAVFVLASCHHVLADECWKGMVGPNGVNSVMICVAKNNAVEQKIYFPNTNSGSPPTTCTTTKGTATPLSNVALVIKMEEGVCDNGQTIKSEFKKVFP